MGGVSGGSSRRGQEQEDSVSAVGTPELEHLVGLLEVTDWRTEGQGEGADNKLTTELKRRR